MKRYFLSIVMSCFALLTSAQVMDYTPNNDGYNEMKDPMEQGTEILKGKPTLAWGSIDVRYSRTDKPVTNGKMWNATAWKGERINAQAVLWAPKRLKNVTFEVSDFCCGKSVIPATAVKKYFVRYVMTDELNKNGKGTCGKRNSADYDSSLVADVLDSREIMHEVYRTRPLWLNIWVPQSAKPGLYRATLSVKAEGMQTLSLPLSLKVVNHTLPIPKEWQFHLDLWQNPYAVARFFGVPLWSKKHFDLMRPIMKQLADAGQKVITCSIMHWPWNGQTYDAFESMVMRQKNIDGSWTYDYGVFDRWVSFMMELGIDKQINCYTLVPWNLKFDYYDQATNTVKYVQAKPGEKDYEDYWLPFLKNFAAHLKVKGWFERTTIALDERPKDMMNAAFDLLQKVDKNFKVSGACNYYNDIEPRMYDMCVTCKEKIPTEVLQHRRDAEKVTTYYTCCVESYPNTFTFSAPAEATWIPWHVLESGYDGYLRWAYNSWTEKPLLDTRFRTWGAGDCFLVYPIGSSIRMERLVEGIQDAEKIWILRREFAANGWSFKLSQLNEIVARFSLSNLNGKNATEMVNAAKQVFERF